MPSLRIERVGFMDVVSISCQRNTCLVLPTLDHAFNLWPYYRALCESKHKWVKKTKTGMGFGDTGTILRLWVPYSLEPTMPMDWEHHRRGFYLISPYGKEAL